MGERRMIVAPPACLPVVIAWITTQFLMKRLLLLTMLVIPALPCAAQEWPARPVRIVAPFAPGGSADTLGRTVAEKLSVRFSQNFVVDNRPGAGGVIGSELVAKSAPDGYTLVVSGIASHVIAPAMGDVPFDPLKNFTHVALFGGPPNVVVVHPGMEAKSLIDFVARSKSLPQGVSYGSPGPGTHGHLVAELFRAQTGAKLFHIPYKGAALAIIDVVGGHVPAAFMTLSTAGAQIKAGRVRALAHTGAKRLPLFADVPTFAEGGYRDLVAPTWFGLSGPPGLAPTVVKRLNLAVREALAASDVRERLDGDGIDSNDLDADGFARFIRAEIAKWTPVAKAAR
jgi:tripartite-type tricarboxylate transporter receptor subunit TctC